MKTRRPWQPHMSNDSLFNPFIPPATDRTTSLDRFDFLDEEDQEGSERNASEEVREEEAGDKGSAS